MTEAEWLAGIDPEPMLEFVQQQKVADLIGLRTAMRKDRLFGSACCWQLKNLIAKAGCLEAIEVAERIADDQADADDHEKAYWDTEEIADKLRHRRGNDDAVCQAARLVNLLFEESGEIPSYAYGYLIDLTPERRRASRRAWARQVIHCIWGTLPFHPLPPRRGKRRWDQERKHWLAWHDGTVPKLARSIYEERAFDRLPVLADALEEAGCTDQSILDHLRGPGPHSRGCWPVDLLLNRI